MTPICRHKHPTGKRCGSPALRDRPYCFYHARPRARTHPTPPRPRKPTPTILNFPLIEDRESLQRASSMVLTALGRNTLEPQRARSLMYALQLARSVTPPNS